MADDNLERITILLQARDRDFARAMDRNNKLMAKFTREAERDSRRMSTAVEGDLKRLTGAAMGVGRAFLGGIAAGAVTATLGGISTNMRGVVAEMSNMAKEADRVGISLDWWQALERGFGQAGVKAGEFTASMTTFTARIGEAAEGSGRLHDALERNGIRLRRSDGELRSTIDLLRDYARAVGGARSEAERVRMVEDAFGRGGRTLANALAGGEEALDGFMRAARDGGFVIDEALIRRAEVLDDRWDDLTRRVGTYFKALAVGIADAITKLDDLRAVKDRALVGDEVAKAIVDEGGALEDHGDVIGRLRVEYDRMSAESSILANSLAQDAATIRALGYEDVAGQLGEVSLALRQLVSDYENGLPVDQFERQLASLTIKASESYSELELIDRVEFSTVISAIGGISRALSEVINRARAARAELPGGSDAAAMARRIGEDSKTGQIASRRIQWETDPTGPTGRPRRAPNDAWWEDPVGGKGKGKGGGKRDGFAAEVEATRARIAELEAEAIVLAAVATGNRQLGDAMEYARKRAELLAAAKREGRAITPELTAEIDQLAMSYMTAGLEAEAAAQRIDRIKEASEKGIDTLTDMFDQIFTRGASARQVLASLVAEIAKVQFRNALLGAASSGGGGFFGLLGNLLLPRRAGGGSAQAGQPYLVNENTPNSEVFVPSQSGAVLNIPQAQAALRPSAQQGPQIVYVPQPYVAKVSADDDGRIIGTMHRIAASTTATGLMEQQRAMPSMLQDMQARGLR